MTKPYVIVWDLDQTIGDFEQLNRLGESSEPITVHLRPGLNESLVLLANAGFDHRVLTLASPEYAEVALHGTGLRHHFSQVEGRGQRNKGDAAGIAEVLGIPEAERPHRMIFVGDNPFYDEPKDPQVVFHLESYAVARSAAVLTRLLLSLLEAGEGSLRRGFDHIGLQQLGWKKPYAAEARMPHGIPVRCKLPDVGQLLFQASENAAPRIVFEHPPEPWPDPEEHYFVPAQVAAMLDVPAI